LTRIALLVGGCAQNMRLEMAGAAGFAVAQVEQKDVPIYGEWILPWTGRKRRSGAGHMLPLRQDYQRAPGQQDQLLSKLIHALSGGPRPSADS